MSMLSSVSSVSLPMADCSKAPISSMTQGVGDCRQIEAEDVLNSMYSYLANVTAPHTCVE